MKARAHLIARAQRGVAFYLFILVVVATAFATVFASRGMNWAMQNRAAQAQVTLQDARRLLLAHLAAPDLDGSGRRLGEFRQFPDLPIANGAGADAAEPAYDGLAETTGCAWRGWSPGQALQPVAVAGPRARCIGRFPWRDLGLSLADATPNDEAGQVPWMIVSPNLAVDAGCLPNLNPLVLSLPFTGFGCLGSTPFPWIRVVDERGNLVSDRVAIAIILPGPAMAGQTRSATAGPSAWLDSVTIGAGCPAPCQPGTYDNAGLNHADGQPTVLIQAPQDAGTAARLGYATAPYQFNDRVSFLTIDDVMAVLEQRARSELMRSLLAFRTAKGYFPYAAEFVSGLGVCVGGLRFGHPPLVSGTCDAGDVLSLPAWFTDAGWHRYFTYAVSPRCVRGANACNAPGLVVGSNNAVNALIIGPGKAITTPPFAASRGIAQAPLALLGLSALAADYLDSVENAAGAPDVFEPTTNLPAPNNDRLDIVQ